METVCICNTSRNFAGEGSREVRRKETGSRESFKKRCNRVGDIGDKVGEKESPLYNHSKKKGGDEI